MCAGMIVCRGDQYVEMAAHRRGPPYEAGHRILLDISIDSHVDSFSQSNLRRAQFLSQVRHDQNSIC